MKPGTSGTRSLALLLAFAFFCPFPSAYPMAQKNVNRAPSAPDPRLEGFVNAPEFPSGFEWLNTDKPIALKNLRGKIVLLDFWTFCCINCMHVIPDLKKLEAKYPEELVVIGVHSAKFENEKDTESIRQAILRYEIHHPVINDRDMEIWNQYGVRAWPTLVLINPEGKIIGSQSGEDIFDMFDSLISAAIPYFDSRGRLKRSPMKLALEEARQPNTLLSFPGKIHADAKGRRLFISDSNHNRILVSDPDGNIQTVIGSGRSGPKDGDFENAEFNHPQGVFLDGDTLYIADTENHLIRKADLKTRAVTTLLGTGQKAVYNSGGGRGRDIPLSSPWDLVMAGGKLYIAMAGHHQLWVADPATGEAKPYAGSGPEARADGPLNRAALAQPSGLTTDGKKLYFADSEVSSIRSADLDPAGNVETLIGKDLFEFGDVDGDSEKARLQHALGVVYERGRLYVADTYNSKIKIIDPAAKTSVSFAGQGSKGLKDGPAAEAQFFEPGGLAVLDEKLYVADTNNHQIRVIDIARKTVSTLELKGLKQLARAGKKTFRGRVIRMPEKKIREGKGTVWLSFELPEGFKFNKEAPLHLEVKSEGETVAKLSSDVNALDKAGRSFPFEIPLVSKAGKHDLVMDAVIYYCRKESGICLFEEIRVEQPVEVTADASQDLKLEVAVSPKVPA